MLITEEYRATQRELHERHPGYGSASTVFAQVVAGIARSRGVSELLDYGAGKCRLQNALRRLNVELDYHPFEPAFEHLAAPPEPREMVACIDVLEHVEPDCLDDVLDDLKRVTKRLAFITVHTGPAVKFLPDGRNAHLTQRPASWWLPKLCARFEPLLVHPTENGFFTLLGPL